MNVTPARIIAIQQAYHTLNKTHCGNSVLAKLLAQYSPVDHIVGVKSVRLDLKDSHTGTVQYPREGVVTCTDFKNTTTCGNGLHFSFGHSVSSMLNTLVTKQELGAKFQLALLPSDKTVVVSDKLKAPMAYIVHTGTFAEIHAALALVFPEVSRTRAQDIVVQPR